MASGTIRYWAAAKDAAGRESESYEAETLAEALEALRSRYFANDRLLKVLDRSSFLVDEYPVGKRAHGEVVLKEGGTVEVLPPFAGG
ncbi:molybdopterin converting factor small subunit [Lipingzhangella halophila]|uniref:Molybdopterin converting factor small subunit n=1 Tax=Lipingzhangella halophila TaxID=1783352 RepID=A0A7W7RMA2_9ACTN|nr:MoaD/ThiS family protein [Lipingzhangella halophila]MBB4934178.1 molybdopterin converting factor small subunit [Lipingzhangella halophila]